jgi:NRPS condensation-like uncharacterized protein
MEAGLSHKISGADKFQLLLDRHIRLNQSNGNIIQLSIEVKGRIELEELRKVVSANSFLTQLNSLQVTDNTLSIPRWINGEEQYPVSLTEFPYKSAKVSEGLIDIALFQDVTNTKVLILVHHVLADNMGIQQIARLIDGTIKPPLLPFAEEEKDATSFIQELVHTLKATLLVFKKTPKRMAKLVSAEVLSQTAIIEFDTEETKKIEENAAKNGARLSRSAFYLAAVSMALKQTIFEGNKGDSFFLPVPQNQRLRGNEQLAMGNHLSFLFYTIPFNKLNNLSEATAFITSQMVEQIKDQSPKSYSYLLKTFRFLPLWLYDFFFKMPTKGAVCSFLFSDVGETLPDMKTFMGREIVEVLNLPPNPCPPHITFVMMKHAGTLKLIMTYNSKAISEDEISKFEAVLRTLLKE